MPPPIRRDSDSTTELLRRSYDGDRAAEAVLYLRLRAPLLRWATGRLPRWAREGTDTEDVVQNALAKTLVERRAGTAGPGFRAYVRRTILNEICDLVRRASLKRKAELSRRPADPSPLEELLGRERLERFDRALGRLSMADRTIVVCRVELGMSYVEIAAELGRPSPDAARMSVARALARLAREMDDGA